MVANGTGEAAGATYVPCPVYGTAVLAQVTVLPREGDVLVYVSRVGCMHIHSDLTLGPLTLQGIW